MGVRNTVSGVCAPEGGDTETLPLLLLVEAIMNGTGHKENQEE